ncbi:MAG: c-type cytochrome, partial [Pseudomonadota bacterium]
MIGSMYANMPMTLGLASAFMVAISTPTLAGQAEAAEAIEPTSVIMPMVDPERGRRLFVTKGCVLCHAVNGVGGIAAPALDTEGGNGQLDLLGFVVRMWNGAQAM